MELFARCGIINVVEKLKSKYDHLLSLIDDNLHMNLCIREYNSRNWSPYFGFALEENWKRSIQVQCDLLFRTLLIIHYVEGS